MVCGLRHPGHRFGQRAVGDTVFFFHLQADQRLRQRLLWASPLVKPLLQNVATVVLPSVTTNERIMQQLVGDRIQRMLWRLISLCASYSSGNISCTCHFRIGSS